MRASSRTRHMHRHPLPVLAHLVLDGDAGLRQATVPGPGRGYASARPGPGQGVLAAALASPPRTKSPSQLGRPPRQARPWPPVDLLRAGQTRVIPAGRRRPGMYLALTRRVPHADLSRRLPSRTARRRAGAPGRARSILMLTCIGTAEVQQLGGGISSGAGWPGNLSRTRSCGWAPGGHDMTVVSHATAQRNARTTFPPSAGNQSRAAEMRPTIIRSRPDSSSAVAVFRTGGSAN